jgi:hypothetical protein
MKIAAQLLLVLGTTGLVVACGSGCGGGGAPARDGQSNGDSASLTQQKRKFMADCTKKVPDGADYCECAWEVFARTFTKEEMSATPSDDDERFQKKFVSFKEQMTASCGSKMPERSIKAAFLKACPNGGKLTPDYCECKYAELRKKITVSEFTDDQIVTTARFVDARKTAVKACSTKLPEGPTRETWVRGCVSGGGVQDFCECSWKTARKTWSTGELVEGTMGKEDLLEKIRACAPASKR